MKQDIHSKEKRSALLHVAVCFCECNKKILFLQRSNNCKEPKTWTAPGGKIEEGEDPIDASIREFSEETGILLPRDCIKSKGSFVAGTLERPLAIHLFQAQLSKEPTVTLSSEHQTYRWCYLEEIWDLPLISGANRCLEIVYQK